MVNRGGARERCDRDAGGDELPGSDWRQLSHWHAVAGDQEDSPRSRPRMISPLELRSSRWVIDRATMRV